MNQVRTELEAYISDNQLNVDQMEEITDQQLAGVCEQTPISMIRGCWNLLRQEMQSEYIDGIIQQLLCSSIEGDQDLMMLFPNWAHINNHHEKTTTIYWNGFRQGEEME